MHLILSISCVTLGFMAWYFTTQSEAFAHWFSKHRSPERAKIDRICYQRWLGALIYGVVPVSAAVVSGLKLSDVGLSFRAFFSAWEWIVGLSAVIFVLNYFAAQPADNLAQYPQIRIVAPWHWRLKVISALTWAAYLWAYEFLFRGLLLFTSAAVMDKWPAIALNIAFYVFAHVFKGWKESVGSIPMGLALCLLTLHTGSIWPAFWVHVSLAWSNEWWSLYFAGKGAGRSE